MKTLAIFSAALVFASCTYHPSEIADEVSTAGKANVMFASNTTFAKPVVKYGCEGYYTGMFVAKTYDETKEVFDNKITVSIDSLNGGKIYGHSVVAGNSRPFAGTCEKKDNDYQVIAKEPGDDKYDGTFNFVIHTNEKTIEGTWLSNDKKLTVTERSYTLESREFVYDPENELSEDMLYNALYGTWKDKTEEAEVLTEDVLKINPSETALKKEDVENMYQGDLEVLRNSIYARHGYSFKNRKMRLLFDNYVEWYMPVSTDITQQLTEIEKKNIDLIKRYEAHAAKYYDVFGR